MRISEVYGPVRQGEGRLIGELMPFIRTASCNLSCSWCDSAYTWKGDYQYTDMTPTAIVNRVAELVAEDGRRCRWVSLTGGEPTIQHEAGELVRLLIADLYRVIVETNGLVNAPWFDNPFVFVSCSPKLPGSGQDSRLRRARIRRLAESRRHYKATTQYKFVIDSDSDLEELVDYCNDVGIARSGEDDGSQPVYVQPNGYIQPVEKYLERLDWLHQHAPSGVLVTPQVHRLIHGPDVKGV